MEELYLDAWSLIPWASGRFGSRIACVDNGGSGRPEDAELRTYQQLAGRCCLLAKHMAASWGVIKGVRVGILMRNSTAVLETHFAAAALHAVVVNVNVSLAPRELAHVLRDSGCEVLIADGEFAAALSDALVSDTAGEGGSGPPLQLKHVAWASKTAASSGGDPAAAAGPALYLPAALGHGVTQTKYEGELFLPRRGSEEGSDAPVGELCMMPLHDTAKQNIFLYTSTLQTASPRAVTR